MQNATLLARLHGFHRDEANRRAEEALRLLGLQPLGKRQAETLSGGQLQRLQIARALSFDAELLILDEPKTGLDVEGQEAMWEYLRREQAKGVGMLLWNWRSSYLGRLVEPLAYLAFMVVGIGASMKTVTFDGHATSYLQFVLPGILALLTVRAGIGTVSDFSNDRKWGVYAFARSTGVGPAGYLLSLIIASTLFCYLQAAAVLAVGALLGWVGRLGPTLLLLVLLPVFVAFWVLFGAMIGALVNSYAQRDLIVNLSSLPIVLAAPLFYYLDGAPSFLRILASINPLSYQVDLARQISVSAPSLSTAVVTVGLLVAVFVLALVSLSRAEWLTVER